MNKHFKKKMLMLMENKLKFNSINKFYNVKIIKINSLNINLFNI